jgi:hypothetical protein
MTPHPYFFRVFNLNKYREIEPVIADILNSSVDAERMKFLLKEAIDIVEGDVFKKYNDDSMRYEYGVFQSIANLIDENKFEEWTEKKDDDWEEYYPENVALRFIEVLCCPKYQLYCFDHLPQSENTFGYQYSTDAFYSFGKDIHGLIRETGAESLPFRRGICFFNPRQLAKFSKIISDDYELLRDPENTLYAIYKKNPGSEDSYMVSEIFSRPPTDEELEGEYYALPDSARQMQMISFYEKIINFLILIKPGFTILNDFCLLN